MPTYEYLCKKCRHRFEQWQKMMDEPLEICSECGGTVRRVYYPAGIVFKGSGFYKTDHNSASNANSDDHTHTGENGAAAAGTPESATSKEHEQPPPTAAEPGSKSTETAKSENKVTAPTSN